METLLCTDCKTVNWLEYGCINNKQKGAEICLECCGCPEHHECCEHEYESSCACCLNDCEVE